MLPVIPNNNLCLYKIYVQMLCLKQTRPELSSLATTLRSIDKRGGRPWQETSYRNSLLSFMDELGLVDVYRVLHPKKKAFTYESKTLRLKSRIDFFSLHSL